MWFRRKKIKDEEGKGFADSIGAGFTTVSAKENVGIQELIEKIAEAAKNKNLRIKINKMGKIFI